jgi:hypothetical protein
MVPGAPAYTVFELGARGVVTQDGKSKGAYTLTNTTLNFENIAAVGYTSLGIISSFASKYIQYNNESDPVALLFPSGAGGIGVSPFYLSMLNFAHPLNPMDPLFVTLTGSHNLTMTFAYLVEGGTKYSLIAIDTNPSTGNLVKYTATGIISEDKNTATVTETNSFVLRIESTVVSGRGGGSVLVPPEPVPQPVAPKPVPQPIPAPQPVLNNAPKGKMKGMMKN